MSNFLANILASAAKALGKVDNIESVALADLGLIANGEANYVAGNPVVLGTMSEGGKSGKIVAIADGSDMSKALGLS